jgi:hypothetical protein
MLLSSVSDNNGNKHYLEDLLATWMGHRYVWNYDSCKFRLQPLYNGIQYGVGYNVNWKMRKPENKGVNREDAARKKVQDRNEWHSERSVVFWRMNFHSTLHKVQETEIWGIQNGTNRLAQ